MTLLMLSAATRAHVGIEDPPPRYPSDGFSDNKSCPCGAGPNNGTCSDPTARGDANRSTNVTTYDAGQTITITAHEVVGHAGRWRVAFDPDGADQGDFDAHILLDVEDPSGATGNAGGDLWEFVVTLPSTPCTNCTLQLLQMMDGNTVDPVLDPVGRSSYYQCADIVLVGDPVAHTGAPPGEHTGTPTPTDSEPGTTDTDPTTTDGSPTDSDTATTSDGKEGCGCDGAGSALSWVGAAAALLALRRRR
jgi:hypothetical protein